MGGTKYTIVKKGDSTGDGYVKANDYLIIKDSVSSAVKHSFSSVPDGTR